jgi:hypothetical protein
MLLPPGVDHGLRILKYHPVRTGPCWAISPVAGWAPVVPWQTE